MRSREKPALVPRGEFMAKARFQRTCVSSQSLHVMNPGTAQLCRARAFTVKFNRSVRVFRGIAHQRDPCHMFS
uniref:Uncharacterized protein n=1 Tax=Physcomitrium patens TaxID=3218 RepID=A0A2K1KL42_PHYPA|nr:hypothetical protein PHYPA_008164 [Physcomitrium patens]